MKTLRFASQLITSAVSQLAFGVAFIIISGTAVNAQTCVPAPAGLVSWYSGDNNALDARSRNNAALQNGATFVTNGKVAQAIGFDGIDDYAEIPDVSSLKPNNVSVETWVKFDSLDSPNPSYPGLQYLVFKKNSRSAQFEGYALLKVSSGTTHYFEFGVSSDAGTKVTVVGLPVGDTTVRAGEWYHVVGTYDGSAVKLYINGQLIGQNAASFALNYDTTPLFLGSSGQSYFDGKLSGALDETAIYNRALTANEVQAIYAAGSAGKCKPTATIVPDGALIWLSGDGDTLDSSFRYAAVDSSGNNNNSRGFNDGTSISPGGQVGPSIVLSGTNSSVAIPASSSLNVGTSDGMTIELWINPDDVVRLQALVEWNPATSQQGSHLWIYNPNSNNGDGVLWSNLVDTSGNGHGISSEVNEIVAGTFQHVAVTYDKTTGTAVLYRNGVALKTQNLGIFTPQTTYDLYLGNRPTYQYANFAGKMDEVGIHSRALSASEIQSLYNAGIAGKLKQTATFVGANTSTTIGDTALNLPNVTTAGVTQVMPIDANALPALRAGYRLLTSTALSVATTAAYTGAPTVCFHLPALNASDAIASVILHLENNNWVLRTVSRDPGAREVCAGNLTNPSVFAIAAEPTTAASVTLGGRVLTGKGRGIFRARVNLIEKGKQQSVITGANGYYRFLGVEAGQTVFIKVQAKRFRFIQDVKAVTVAEDREDIDFTALN